MPKETMPLRFDISRNVLNWIHGKANVFFTLKDDFLEMKFIIAIDRLYTAL